MAHIHRLTIRLTCTGYYPETWYSLSLGIPRTCTGHPLPFNTRCDILRELCIMQYDHSTYDVAYTSDVITLYKICLIDLYTTYLHE